MKIGRAFFAVVPDKGRTPLPCIVALGAFYLDDFGAEIGKGLTGKRARKDPRQFDHFQACEGLHSVILDDRARQPSFSSRIAAKSS